MVKSISIPIDLNEKLSSVDNVSELITKLLYDYFQSDKKQDLEAKLIDIEKERAELFNEINKQIQEKEEKHKEALLNLQAIKDQQLKKINEDITLLEAEPELIKELVEWCSTHEKDIDTDKEFMLDMVNKFRNKGYRIGVTHLKNYWKYGYKKEKVE